MMIGPADPTQRASNKTIRGQPRGGVLCCAARPQSGSGALRTDQHIGKPIERGAPQRAAPSRRFSKKKDRALTRRWSGMIGFK
jgi:hypothetical protein